jgi:phage shock protein A
MGMALGVLTIMAHFSRLTDIVTCNLTTLLARNNNSPEFLEEVIGEMDEGVAGAQRCVNTAVSNVMRLEAEIAEQRAACQDWVARAQKALRDNNDDQARLALERKHEVEDLIAGLEQQLQAAISTRDHLRTMHSAIQARRADALRRLEELRQGISPSETAATPAPATASPYRTTHNSRVDSELEELRRMIASE